MSDPAAPTSPPVIAAPGAAVAPTAVFYDGASSRRHVVTLRFGPNCEIVEGDTVIAAWAYEDLRRKDSPPRVLRLSSTSAPPLARLEITDEATQQAIYSHAQSLNQARGRAADTAQVVVWSLGAVVSIVLLVMFGVPLVADRLAPLVPLSFEKRFGQAADNQVKLIYGTSVCNNGEGHAAFEKLVDKVRLAGGIKIPFSTEVLNSSVANAFALPGGKVYLLSGLLTRAESVDEIAGVIAHELGHVQHRDHMRRLIQTGGTSFLVGLLFGDVTGSGAVIFATRTLFDASYSRDSETAADTFAVDAMRGLGRSPKPMGELLFRITGAQGKSSISILAGHPMTEDRLARMTREDRSPSGPEILTATEWQALKSICQPAAAAPSPNAATRLQQRPASGRGQESTSQPGAADDHSP